MKKINVLLIICLIIFGCKTIKIEQPNMHLKPFATVYANAETYPVSSAGDAADDICIWVNEANITRSTIIGTNKKKGLVVYNLQGKQLYKYPVGKVNNVDIRSGFLLGGKKVSVVAASNRTYNTITVHVVNPKTGELIDKAARPIKSTLKKVYGLGMYKSKISGKFYVFICGKSGGLEQWELFENKENLIDAKLVREIAFSSQCEGIATDDYHAKLYVGEEDKALWKLEAEPTKNNQKIQVVSVQDKNMKSDFEGITIYDSGEGNGYIILSSQGNNSYAVFDRITNLYQGSFKIEKGAIDGTNDTDGIDVTSQSFGKLYPNGFFIAQDGTNTDSNGNKQNQNFKLVNWQLIMNRLDLK